MPPFVPKRPGHAAAAGVQIGGTQAGHERQRIQRARHSHERLLMAMAVDDTVFGSGLQVQSALARADLASQPAVGKERLRGELWLAEYLPRGLGAGPLDEPRRRRALLQRACVMARCGLWEEALADLSHALVETMPGAPLGPAEQALCRRALGKFVWIDLAIESMVDDPSVAHRFKRVLENARNADARQIFAAELSRYAWAKLRRRKPTRVALALTRVARALALARQVAGVRSWLTGLRPASSSALEPT